MKITDPHENLFDMVENYIERTRWNGKLSSICNVNQVPADKRKVYLKTQNDLLKSVNIRNTGQPQEKEMHEIIYPKIIRHRLYELNREFPPIISSKFRHSTNGLVRQVIELYVWSLYCRAKPEYKKKTLNPDDGRMADKRTMKNEIKNSKLEFAYLPSIQADFLDAVYSHFRFYSNLFHPAPQSLSMDVWIIDKGDNQAKLLRQKPKLDGTEMVVTPLKDMPMMSDEIRVALDEFYMYAHFVLEEIAMAEM